MGLEIFELTSVSADVDFGTAAEADFNAACDLALNTAIPASNTANSVNDVLLDKLLPTVGALADAAAEGAVTTADTVMAYIKQLVTASIALEKETEYVEEHLHHKTHWYGKNADQTTNWCNGATLTPYRAISGSNTWGGDANDEALCFSAADTLPELGTGLVSGDFDMILVLANSSDTVSRLRLIWGTGTMADAITANQYTEIMYVRNASDTTRIPRAFGCPKIAVENKIWMQHWNNTNNATIDFFLGAHAYAF
jgi:hypothetical protein